MLQPSVPSYMQKIRHELEAKAVLLLHENGQILSRAGSFEEEQLPNLAALIAAMASASRSFGAIAGAGSPSRFGSEFGEGQLYVAAVGENLWLATFHDEVMNPGLFRMRVRKHANILSKFSLGVREEDGATPAPVRPRNDALFENITDEEIDNLFTASPPGAPR